MEDLTQEIRSRYLDRLDETSWDDEDPRLDFGVKALPYFVAAYEKEIDPSRRARLVRIIWQFRDAAALPTLAAALDDQDDEVWKDALDGIVTLGGQQATAILKNARTSAAARPAKGEKLAWIDEAIIQVAEGI